MTETAATNQYRVGDWVLIRFPSDETGKQRKLSCPWHGPYRVITVNDTNLTAAKVYFPREDTIKVHRARAKPCPEEFMAGYYWYGNKKKRDLDGHPNGLRMPWLTRLIVVKGQERTDFKLMKRRVMTPQSMNQKMNLRKKSASVTSQLLKFTALSHEDQVQSQNATDSRKRSGRYSLRERVHPPARLQ